MNFTVMRERITEPVGKRQSASQKLYGRKRKPVLFLVLFLSKRELRGIRQKSKVKT